MVESLAAVAAEPADFRMRLQGVLERAAAAADTEKAPVPGPYVTISREAESGGGEIARRLGERLGIFADDRLGGLIRRRFPVRGLRQTS